MSLEITTRYLTGNRGMSRFMLSEISMLLTTSPCHKVTTGCHPRSDCFTPIGSQSLIHRSGRNLGDNQHIYGIWDPTSGNRRRDQTIKRNVPVAVELECKPVEAFARAIFARCENGLSHTHWHNS